VRLVLLALLAALVLAVTASADDRGPIANATGHAAKLVDDEAAEAPATTGAEETSQSTPTGATEETAQPAPSGPTAETAPETTSGGTTGEATPEPTPPTATESSEATPEPTPAPKETAEATPEPTPAPAPEPTPTPVVAEETPAAAPTEPTPAPTPEAKPVPSESEASAGSPIVKEGAEATTAGAGAGEPPKGSLSSTSTALQQTTAPAPLATEAGALVVAAAAPAVGEPGETWAIPGGAFAPSDLVGAAGVTPSSSCRMTVLAGPITNCTTGWLGSLSYATAAPSSLAATAVSWSTGADVAPTGGGHDDSIVGTRPANPVPGPAPSGASGSAAVGGSGLALSAFLTLTGLLLLAAPRALRRLRLRCEPWLTAFFVLIPERPG
jgi:outer membrane biosynthesis protein TonB